MKDLPMYFLCFILIPYNIFAERIAEIIGSREIENNLFFVLFIVYLLLNFIFFKNIVISKKVIVFLCANIIVFLGHILQFNNYGEEIKHLVYIIIFLSVASYTDKKCIIYFKYVIVIISSILVVSAFMHVNEVRALNRRMFNIRNYTILDKPYYTLLLPLSIIVLIHQIALVKGIVKKIFIMVLIFSMAYTLYAIFESKMGIIALMVALLVEIYAINGKLKYELLAGGGCGIILLVIFYIVAQKQLPDYIVAFVDFIFGESKAVARVYYDSFYGRIEIITIVAKILIEFPILGCGYGNYYQYASSRHLQYYTLGNMDVESSLIAMFAEGGLVYACICLMMLGYVLKEIWKLCRNKYMEIEMLGLYVCMLFLLIGNDFMNVFFWIFLGIVWANVHGNKKLKNNIMK